MITIRPYTNADYAAVRANLEQVGLFDPVPDAAENLASMVAADPQTILVADIDGHVAGSIYINPMGIYVVCIWRLAVAKQYRRQGVGTALLDTVEAQARARGVKEIWGFFDTTKDHLAAYYKKRGFTFHAEHHYFAMWKPLSADSTAKD